MAAMRGRAFSLRLLYINPNSTVAMTESVLAVAREAVPGHEVLAWTNHDGPPAIQGPEDGDAAVVGLKALLPKVAEAGVDALIIACADDTGLEEIRAVAPCVVLGIGQAASMAALLLGRRFSVVTTMAVSVPVLEDNIHAQGFASICAKVRPTGLPVLDVESGSPAVLARISDEIALAAAEDGIGAVTLGCAGMARLKPLLACPPGIILIDGVAASAHLAIAAAAINRV
jgi:allantoin racemase